MKLLTPEEMEWKPGEAVSVTQYVLALLTVKAACERLARVEVCPHCKGKKGWRQFLTDKWTTCCICDGTGLAHKDGMAALRSLGDKA